MVVVLLFLLYHGRRSSLGGRFLLLWVAEMNWRSFFDNPEELVIDGILSSVPLYFIVGWWVLLLTPLCGVLWRLGGWEHGNKAFRRFGVPLLVCIVSSFFLHKIFLMLAVPFMVWLAPSYGKDSWLFKRLHNDFLTRVICFGWYWLVFSVAISVAVI